MFTRIPRRRTRQTKRTRRKLAVEALEHRLLLAVDCAAHPDNRQCDGGGGGGPALFDFDWAFNTGGNPMSVDHGSDGSVYVLGRFTGTVDFDPGVETHELDSTVGDKFVARYGPDAQFAWVRQFARNVFDVAVEGDSVFVSGGWSLTKLDAADGTNVWEVDIPNFGETVDAGAGQVYVAGSTGLASLDAGNGSQNWVNDTSGLISSASVAFHNDGANGVVYVAGNYGGEACVWKLAADTGNELWFRTTQSPDGNLGASQVAVDALGNAVVTGTFWGTVDFDPGAGVSELTAHTPPPGLYPIPGDVFVWKLQSNGGFDWAKAVGGSSYDRGNDIAIDAAGNVYTTGSFGGLADFNPGPGKFNLKAAGTPLHGWSAPGDAFVLKLDSTGEFVWAVQMGGDSADSAASELDRGTGISVDNTNNVSIVGRFYGSGDFDPTDGEFTLTDDGGAGFVMKLTQPSALTGNEMAVSPSDRLLGLLASQVEPLFSQAIASWNAAGVETSGLSDLEFRVADLPARTLGLASGTTIFVDRDAAGRGWLIEPVGHKQLEFFGGASDNLSTADGRYDLLSVIAHEVGHVLGHRHSHDKTNLMASYLPAGTRRLPGMPSEHASAAPTADMRLLSGFGGAGLLRPSLSQWLKGDLDQSEDDLVSRNRQDPTVARAANLTRTGPASSRVNVDAALLDMFLDQDEENDDGVELVDRTLLEVFADDWPSIR